MRNEKIDTIGRDEFINRIISIVESVSINRGNLTFAIDGKWGVGKTFVLDKLERQLSLIQNEETADNRYFVIHYNAWKYDYYSEPLVTIVSAIANALEEDKIIKQKTITRIKEVFTYILTILYNIWGGAVKKSIGFDLKDTISDIGKIKGKAKNKIEENHRYDVYFDLRKILKEIRDNLNKLSSQYTIVLVVDELDRCLPEYAIKVLERLHHLNEDVENMATIIAVDKSKLNATIKKAFGYKDEIDKVSEQYLKKFIKFTLKLKNNEEKDLVEQKFERYLSLFKNKLFEKDNIGFKQFYNALFCDFEIRERETLMEKAQLIHELVTKEECDKSIMYLELIYIVFEHKLDKDISNFFDGYEFINYSTANDKKINKLNTLFDLKLELFTNRKDQEIFFTDELSGLKGFILWTLSFMRNQIKSGSYRQINYTAGLIKTEQKDFILSHMAKFRDLLLYIDESNEVF